MELVRADALGMEYTYNDIVDKLCEKLMDEIKSCADMGLHECCFHSYVKLGGVDYYSNRYETDMEEKFRRLGYTIKPTGYIGGVWQHTKNICW